MSIVIGPQIGYQENLQLENEQQQPQEGIYFTIKSNDNTNQSMCELNDFSEDDPNERKKETSLRKSGGIRKKPSGKKMRAKEKKLRQNRRLRKVLIPKNALMALHEVKGIKISEFILNNKPGGGFSAEVTVNNIQYEGYGPSKNAAKNNACEKALRDLIISRMLQKQATIDNFETQPVSQLSTNSQDFVSTDEDVQMKDLDEDEDDVPLVNLASFALYKLFSEWENEGFEIPEFRPNTAVNNPPPPPVEKPKHSPLIRNELPLNWETMHPATLLCMMRPGISYVDLGSQGNPPNTIQKMGVTVDGENFVGTGRSKKTARRDVAVIACNKLFGTNFTSN